jgi:hypothetical protein
MRIIHLKAAAVRSGWASSAGSGGSIEAPFWSLFRRPRLIPMAITLSIYGHHFRRVFRKRSVHLR